MGLDDWRVDICNDTPFPFTTIVANGNIEGRVQCILIRSQEQITLPQVQRERPPMFTAAGRHRDWRGWTTVGVEWPGLLHFPARTAALQCFPRYRRISIPPTRGDVPVRARKPHSVYHLPHGTTCGLLGGPCGDSALVLWGACQRAFSVSGRAGRRELVVG